MDVYAFAPAGFKGGLVRVEVDIRRGLPAFDLTGLPDDAVRESRERVRSAIRNAGFDFPVDRVLVNLAPAGLRKYGASFDLPIALGILSCSGQVPEYGRPVLAIGELGLGGEIRPAHGILSAVAAGLAAGIEDFAVPLGNIEEARSLRRGKVRGVSGLEEFCALFIPGRSGDTEPGSPDGSPESLEGAGRYTDGIASGQLPEADEVLGDFSDIRGQPKLRRALEVAAAGGHHVLLFGPPGAGKTLAARRLPTLLPDLDGQDAVEATQIHSLAGTLPPGRGLLRRPPFRSPHHGASSEGVVGGGRWVRPGEVSLAHCGILFLDEAPEFRYDILQALREPVEEGRITIARAETTQSFPARFQLVLAANPCPCGSLGRTGSVCLCSIQDLRRYWRKLGGPLLDRVDIRVPIQPAAFRDLLGREESSFAVRARVEAVRGMQARRYSGRNYSLNGRIPAGAVERFCGVEPQTAVFLDDQAEDLGLSSRALHSILRVSRTIADLEGSADILLRHVREAAELRRYGDEDTYWQIP
ncbi:MAG TPA: YifB family Mg chelatase-like AAA ATPase [Magnetospirillaceae bacterium]|nr:YifB family Mg chelatase-like AAA ATPase [Magnetospirillaceae bacterium]